MQYVTTVLVMACVMLLNGARPLPKPLMCYIWAPKRWGKICSNSSCAHHFVYWPGGLTGVEILPTSKYRSLSLFSFCNTLCLQQHTPASTKLKGGYTGITLSVCGQNCVRSVSSTILIGSISYLHILSSNFRSCVTCNARFKIKKFEILANFLNL